MWELGRLAVTEYAINMTRLMTLLPSAAISVLNLVSGGLPIQRETDHNRTCMLEATPMQQAGTEEGASGGGFFSVCVCETNRRKQFCDFFVSPTVANIPTNWLACGQIRKTTELQPNEKHPFLNRACMHATRKYRHTARGAAFGDKIKQKTTRERN